MTLFRGLKVTRPLNAVTENDPYLQNGRAYEFQTWYTDGGYADPHHQPMRGDLKPENGCLYFACHRQPGCNSITITQYLHGTN